jgi:hypothetical protein
LRLLLDAHLSGARIAEPLRARGHDVHAADEERERILVTFDVKDFPDIARRWAEAERPHAGLAIVVGIDHGEFGAILRVLEALLEEHADPGAWSECTYFVSRGEAE